MGTLTIHFEGICTQIKLPQPSSDGTFHRTVLVHAEHGATIGGMSIPPHFAFLKVDDDATVVQASDNVQDGTLRCLIPQRSGNWQLSGARLSVQNPSIEAVTYTGSSYQLPSLTALLPTFGELSQDVVFGSNAACHFDFNSGTFTSAETEGGSLYCDVAISTTDPDVTVQIVDMADPGKQGTITFRSGSTIVVTNTGGTLGDKEYDFALHYLTAQVLPAIAPLPQMVTAAVGVRASADPGSGINTVLDSLMNYTALGPGCSNSNFP